MGMREDFINWFLDIDWLIFIAILLVICVMAIGFRLLLDENYKHVANGFIRLILIIVFILTPIAGLVFFYYKTSNPF